MPKHSRLGKLAERPAVFVSMLHDIGTDLLDTPVESVNARLTDKGTVTKEDLS